MRTTLIIPILVLVMMSPTFCLTGCGTIVNHAGLKEFSPTPPMLFGGVYMDTIFIKGIYYSAFEGDANPALAPFMILPAIDLVISAGLDTVLLPITFIRIKTY